ncbi:MAG TPA: cation-translocating P-type ATPase [Anaerolineaceae bacterium]|nr:cation-translocating P-type ATPase [Anaerolineaceae bacterium]HQH85436.1 cation-translocating P-type ATPase [Anaerolineaceae bacterium]
MTVSSHPSEKPAAEDFSVTWHALSAEEVLSSLGTQIEQGLTTEEAEKRQAQYGLNQLVEAPRTTFLKMVIDQLNNFVIILLIVAAVVSALLGEWIDAGAILAIVVLNAVLGVIQESRAEQALAALKKLAAPEAQVLRSGHRISVPARELVPGDIVYLEAGNFVPADIRLLEAVNLRAEEAALTGESVPVQKNATISLDRDIPLGDRKNTVFMGTVVNYGRGRGVVTSTGMHTQLGMIATMLQSVEEENTPLQQRLDQLGKILGYGALAVCGLVFLVGLIRALGSMGFAELFTTATGLEEVVDLFMIAVSLAIAAVPEGLPAVVTISLALGMREMVHRHALIRRLSSVETLGSATVICSDKTGTLTQNEMTVTKLWVDGQFVDVTGTGYRPQGEFMVDGKAVNLHQYPAAMTALWLGVLNNDAQLEVTPSEEGGDPVYRIIGDPTEGSIIVAAAKAGLGLEQLIAAFPRENEIPFDSTRKRMVTMHLINDPRSEITPATLYHHAQQYTIAVKGAPDVVLNLCNRYQHISDDQALPLDEAARARILAANDTMTQGALRVLGVAYRAIPALPEEVDNDDLERDLIFVGLIGMIDPARTEVRPALETARGAGIRTIMITGDYPNTAKAIAESIHLLSPGHQVLTGAQLNEMTDAELQHEVQHTDVFARVSPEHKMRIVDALRANDEVVAMTGDGVNDAPAIKASDIGVAMGITGTDVAKETADMVLTDDNYASIVSAVEQGRIIYANIRKFVFFLLSSNVAEIMIIFLATLAGVPTPLTAIQLLWLNLLTDGAPALALAMEKGDPDVMERAPRPKKEPIINKSMRLGIGIQTIMQTGAVLAAFAIGLIWELQHTAGITIPDGMNPIWFLIQFNDWAHVADVKTAETMAFVTLSLCELFRAYTVRSERASVFRLGLFSNKYMQYAVALSIVLMLLVVNVPFLQTVFNTHFLSWDKWLTVVGLALLPAIAEEFTKLYLRKSEQRPARS